MLNPAAARSVSTARRRTIFKPGLALKVVLFFVATTYVLGPSLVQWVSFEQVRYEVAATRIAEAPTTTVLEEPSEELVALLQEVTPDNVDSLVAPGLNAVGAINEGAVSLGAMAVSATIRAVQVALGALAVAVLTMRMTNSYRPRHSRGFLAALLSRKG